MYIHYISMHIKNLHGYTCMLWFHISAFCIVTCLFCSSANLSGSVHQFFIPSVIPTVWTQRGQYDTDRSDHRQVKAFVDFHTPLLIQFCVKFFFFFFGPSVSKMIFAYFMNFSPHLSAEIIVLQMLCLYKGSESLADERTKIKYTCVSSISSFVS